MTRPGASMEGMDQPDLFDALREHDLPPRWDGAPVEWGGWTSEGVVFICPPIGQPLCAVCGSTTPRLVSHGIRTIPYDENVVPVGVARLQAHETRRRMVAHRCPDCRHDTVWDQETDQVWDLDATDYGDDGSHPPPRSTAR